MVRSRNEDNFVNRPDLGIWAVADGAGGHEAGDVAARIVTDALSEMPPGLGASELLAEARLRLAAAHDSIRGRGGAARRASDPGDDDRRAVGASRPLCLPLGRRLAGLSVARRRLGLLSHDHSLVQELVDAGALRPEQALHHPRANVITRAVGADKRTLELDKMTDRLRPGDRFLLCSDGVSKILPEAELARLLGE